MCATLRASPARWCSISVREVGLLRGTRRRFERKTGQALVHSPRRVCGCGSCAVTVGATQAAVRAGGMRPAPPPLLFPGPFAPGVRQGPGAARAAGHASAFSPPPYPLPVPGILTRGSAAPRERLQARRLPRRRCRGPARGPRRARRPGWATRDTCPRSGPVPEWRNGRRRGLKLRWASRPVWVRLPPPVPESVAWGDPKGEGRPLHAVPSCW